MNLTRSYGRVLTVFVVALTIAVVCGCNKAKESKQDPQDEAQAMQAAQQQAAKVAELIQGARTAFDAEQYPDALTAIDKVLLVDAANSEAAELRSEIVVAQKLARALPLKKKAEARWSKVRTLSPDQGFAQSISSIETRLNEAGAAFDAADYDVAINTYDGLVTDCDTLQELAKDRNSAAVLRENSEQMWKRCVEADAEHDAPTLWATALEFELNASTAFENGNFADAQDVWKKSFDSFVAAEQWAVGVQAVREVEQGYADDLLRAREEINLDKFGGSAWGQTTDMIALSARLVAEGEWQQAATAIADARMLLVKAVQRAKEEKHRQAREFAVSRLEEALAKAKELLVFAEQTPKRQPGKGLPFLVEGLGVLAQCRNTSWYGVLTAAEIKSIESLKHQILLERFHFLFPDLVAVTTARMASTANLAPGSEVAQSRQSELASLVGFPVEVRTRKSGILMRLIPPGSFIMGSRKNELYAEPDETRHTVTITKPFYIGVTEVSQRQWRSAGMRNRSCFAEVDSELPAENVSWNDAVTYCDLLCRSEIAPNGSYRLPTEAEWEYAARAGTQTAFYFSDTYDKLDAVAWHAGNSGNRTQPIGTTAPNAWGLCDTIGNVWEWCMDSPAVYSAEAVSDPVGSFDGFRAIRGGSWDEAPRYCRSANRGLAQPSGLRSFDIGLRIIREIDGLPQ